MYISFIELYKIIFINNFVTMKLIWALINTLMQDKNTNMPNLYFPSAF